MDGVKLAHNRGRKTPLLAGLMTAMPLCDCAISMDADLQDDINVVDRFVEKYMEGCDVVYGVRNKRETDTFFKRTTAEGFYKFMKILGVDVVFNHADYRLMSRRALEGLSEYKEVNLFLRGIVPLIGFKSDYVYYDRAERFAGESKYPLKKMISFALDGITSFSVKPLKLISNLGILISVLSIFGLLYALISHLCGVTVAGWTAIVASIWLLGGLQMLCLGVVGGYIGKIYSEVKQRPRFLIETHLKAEPEERSWTNTDTLTKPGSRIVSAVRVFFPAAHGMLSLRGTFYENSLSELQIFLGSVFGCVLYCSVFTQCTYAKKQTFLLSNIALLLFGIALFVLFLSLDRLQQVKLYGIGRPYRPMCSYTVCVCFYFPHSSIFIITFISKPVGTRASLQKTPAI